MIDLVVFMFCGSGLAVPVLLTVTVTMDNICVLDKKGAPKNSVGVGKLVLMLTAIVTCTTCVMNVGQDQVTELSDLGTAFCVLLSKTVIFLMGLTVGKSFPSPVPGLTAAVSILVITFLPALMSSLALVLTVHCVNSAAATVLKYVRPLATMYVNILFLNRRLRPVRVKKVMMILSTIYVIVSNDCVEG